MIVEWFLSIAQAVVSWVLSLFPQGWTPPAEFTEFAGFVSEVMGWFVGLGVWIPWAVIGVCVGIQVGTWGVTLLVKGVRWLVGLIPTMGGGT